MALHGNALENATGGWTNEWMKALKYFYAGIFATEIITYSYISKFIYFIYLLFIYFMYLLIPLPSICWSIFTHRKFQKYSVSSKVVNLFSLLILFSWTLTGDCKFHWFNHSNIQIKIKKKKKHSQLFLSNLCGPIPKLKISDFSIILVHVKL